MKKHSYGIIFISFSAGAINTLSFSPFGYQLIPYLSIGIFYLLLHKENNIKSCIMIGISYGLGWFIFGLHWLHFTISTYGAMSFTLASLTLFLLCLYLSLFPALSSAIFHYYKGYALSPFFFASIWFITESLRAYFLGGFPWISLGYSQTDGFLKPWFPWIGEHGVSFLLALLSCLLVHFSFVLFSDRKYSRVSMFSILSLLISTLVLWKTNSHEWHYSGQSMPISIVQGNVPQSDRWIDSNVGSILKKYSHLTSGVSDNRVVVWPEAAIPILEPKAQPFITKTNGVANKTNSNIITGIIDYRNGQFYNSMIVIGNNQLSHKGYDYESTNRYHKRKLVPIGEFIPFYDKLQGMVPLLDLPFNSIQPGKAEQSNLTALNFTILPAICFEIAFSHLIRANLDTETDVIVTISNDDWFGPSIGPWQHFQIARTRAIEYGVPLIRSANSGISAVIAPDGSVVDRLPQFQEAVLTAEVKLTSGSTVYRRIGDAPIQLISLLLLLSPWFLKRLQRLQASLN
ncbi:apolipoprotein N-acyltransferase [Ferrimonas balearica]|uniref:apolipoprotein N-acyltransferase n=1 Tax=Ferrimonas balearica TaxID=44012 RepID=UPI001C951F1E|nr:apolipoprotein N-acyltransferase [Ferrimonas balearica]MBY5980602.1 apolipoprotein N-acyltransferase [Ferrimonas balearica]